MNELFVVSVNYQDTKQEFKARLERWGYTHRISVLIEETTVIFEPDEEGSYRALYFDKTLNVQAQHLQALAQKLAKLLE